VSDDVPALAIIVAAGTNGVIGRDGALPWHLGTDLRRFKALTMGKPMIMGRKTYASIGRPLPGRDTVVLTRDARFRAEGVHIVHSVEEAIGLAARLAAARGASEIAVIGGEAVFAAVLPRADRLHLTAVEAAPGGDAVFPAVDPAEWREVTRESHPAGPVDDHPFAFVDYVRRVARVD
jgi:dihydrofolate reductase